VLLGCQMCAKPCSKRSYFGVGVTFFVFYSCIFVHCYLLHVCKAAMADISPPYPSTQHTLSPRRLFLLP
jgi:hypothetical protein